MAAGSNFDWYRHDIKPGQLNLNLIMDEEVFFSVAGKAAINQTNGQSFDPTTNGRTDGNGNPVNSGNQFVRDAAEFQPDLAGFRCRACRFTAAARQLRPGINGTSDFTCFRDHRDSAGSAGGDVDAGERHAGDGDADRGHGQRVAGDDGRRPDLEQFLQCEQPDDGHGEHVGPPYPNGNDLKAAWVQFLNLRHGGSGYIFGYGLGAVGQNSAIAPLDRRRRALPTAMNGSLYGDGHSGRAAVPVAVVSGHQLHDHAAGGAAAVAVYGPDLAIRATTTVTGVTTYYAGDPGVRNATLFVGYPTGTYPGTPPRVATGTRTTRGDDV